MVLTVALVGGQAWAGFGVGVYLGDLFEEWVPAPDSDEVSGAVTVRYTCDGDPPYQDAFFIALPPGGDEPSDWRCIPGWTPVGPLPAGGQHAVSEEIRTAIWRDGTWEVWVALARWIEEGKDGGGGGGVPSYDEPDVPFPSGVFPPEDPEFMIVDAVLGPFGFEAKNLTVGAVGIHPVDPAAATMNDGILYAAVTAAGMLGWDVGLRDGREVPDDPAPVTVDVTLSPLGQGTARHGTNDGTAPGAVSGLLVEPQGVADVGFYYMRADAGEQTTGDWASNVSSAWALSDVHGSGYEYMGARKARLTVTGTLNTTEAPSEQYYAWCKPLPRPHAEEVVPDLVTHPVPAFSQVDSEATAVFGSSLGLDLSIAGTHYLAMSFRDTLPYHSGLGRWTPPGGGVGSHTCGDVLVG